MPLASNASQPQNPGMYNAPRALSSVVAPRSRTQMMHLVLRTVAACVLLFASITMFLANLGSSSISLMSDEVIYVRVTQGIVQTGELFPLRHGSAPSFEKPPLKFWLSALLPALFGESNLTYRLLDGAFGVLAIALATLLSYNLSRSFPPL